MKVEYRHQMAKAFLEMLLLHFDNNYLEEAEGLELTVYCYQNGREHGYEIKNYDARLASGLGCRAVTFAENRNSDHLAVFFDNTACSNLSEEAYKSGKYFSSDKWDEALRICAEHLLEIKEAD